MKKFIGMFLMSVMVISGASMFASADTVPVENYYVSTDSPLIWEETNGCAGLQTAASNCDTSDAEDEDADTKIA